jgi:kinesin family protein 20
MDEISPAVVTIGSDIVQCDGIEITTNLFKNHKMSTNLVNNKNERLNTYLRIRALNQNETQSKTTQSCFKVLDSKCLLVIPPKGSNTHKNGSELEERKFSFTQIFDERVDQLAVYENCALDIVKRFLCGENGLLFAYGITSSGKSYTMRGTTSSPGVIPRALNTIFDVIGHRIVKEMPNLKPNRFCEFISLSKNDKEFEDNLRKFIFDTIDKKEKLSLNSFHSQISSINETTNHENHWNDVLHSTFRSDVSDVKCCVWISFYEIYNETIYDLLDLEISGEKKQNIILLKDENQNYYIKGLRQICVSSAEEAYKVLLFGQNNLHISSTDLNKRSSRSHCAFNISIIRTNTTSKRPIITVNK